LLGKTLLSKNAHEKTHVHRARFNGRPKLPGWPGKRWRLGEQWLLQKGEGKEVRACAVVSGRGFCLRAGLPFWLIHKGNNIVLSMMTVLDVIEKLDQELGKGS
jgi:hypothetical protein